MINGLKFSNQPVKSNLTTYDNIRKIATSQGDDYTTGCLLDYSYFNIYQKMRAKDLSKQEGLDADPKAIKQLNFTGNLKGGENVNNNTMMFFLLSKKWKKQS